VVAGVLVGQAACVLGVGLAGRDHLRRAPDVGGAIAQAQVPEGGLAGVRERFGRRERAVGPAVERDRFAELATQRLLHPVDAGHAHLGRADEGDERREDGVADDAHPPVGVVGLIDDGVGRGGLPNRREVVAESEQRVEHIGGVEGRLPHQSAVGLADADDLWVAVDPHCRPVPGVAAARGRPLVHAAVLTVPEIRLAALDGRL